jgi:hypothetical protein
MHRDGTIQDSSKNAILTFRRARTDMVHGESVTAPIDLNRQTLTAPSSSSPSEPSLDVTRMAMFFSNGRPPKRERHGDSFQTATR